MYTAEEMRCPKCKNIAVKLIPIPDTGKSIKVCRKCKKKTIERLKKILDKGENKT